VSAFLLFRAVADIDLTVTGRGYTKQGFLGEAEWRQRFNNGGYTLKVAGINQTGRRSSTRTPSTAALMET
jgi:lipopolysaccharide assembly outer membrane protein LptD (OstA)